MSFSNLHSFHFAQILQNSHALPSHVYQKIRNRHSVNAELHQDINPGTYAAKPQNSEYTIASDNALNQNTANAVKSDVAPDSIEEFVPSPFPEQREAVTLEGEITGNPQTPTPPTIKTVVPTRPKQQPNHVESSKPILTQPNLVKARKLRQDKEQPRKKPFKTGVWKPGRGTIEKVDKLTGEIVHLTEAYAD
ncbi:MAG: hypothetical protein ACPGSM_04745 [Thiolinea sp.]